MSVGHPGDGCRDGRLSRVPMAGWWDQSCCAQLCAAGFLVVVSMRGLQKVAKINLLTGDLGAARSECFALTT